MPCEPEPEAEIDVLDITEEVVVEASHVPHGGGAIDRCGRTRREDFAAAEIVGSQPAAMTTAPHEAADVAAVAEAVDHLGPVIEHLPRTKGRGFRMGGGGGKHALQPLGLRKGIGIEQGDQRRVGRVDAAIAGGRKAEVTAEQLDLCAVPQPFVAGDRLRAGRGGVVLAGVVEDEDHRRETRLDGEAFQAPHHVAAAVVVHDDHGDVGGGHGRKTIPSARADPWI